MCVRNANKTIKVITIVGTYAYYCHCRVAYTHENIGRRVNESRVGHYCDLPPCAVYSNVHLSNPSSVDWSCAPIYLYVFFLAIVWQTVILLLSRRVYRCSDDVRTRCNNIIYYIMHYYYTGPFVYTLLKNVSERVNSSIIFFD